MKFCKFVCVFFLLSLLAVGDVIFQQRFLPRVYAEPEIPNAKWVFFRDSHVDYGSEDEQRWLNQCDWIAEQGDIDLVLNAGDFVTIPTNDTAWDVVAQGIQKFNSSTPFLSCVGNHDAGYNATKGEPDYDRYLEHTGMSSPNYTYIFTKPDFGSILVISLGLTFDQAVDYYISSEEWTWFDNQVNSTDLPVVVLMHVAPAEKYCLHRVEGTRDSYWDDHLSKHENLFLILFGHSHEQQYYVGKGAIGNPILMYTSYAFKYGTVHKSYLAILSWYSDRLEITNYDPWTDTWLDSSRDGEKMTFSFAGVTALPSGHLRNDDYTRTGNEETEYHSPPKSYYPSYVIVLSEEIPIRRTSFWFQIWAYLKSPYMDLNHISLVYHKGLQFKTPLITKWKTGYLYPNGTSGVNCTLSEGWYNYVFFVNETSEVYEIYVYNTTGSLRYSGEFDFCETLSGFGYGFKIAVFRPYGYFDDFATTYDTEVTTESGTQITLSNGTQISDTSFDLRAQTAAIWQPDCTVKIGDETQAIDIYGGDEIANFYFQYMLLIAVIAENNNLRDNGDPYIWNVTRPILSLSYTSSEMSFTVSASIGQTSTTNVYCADRGKPNKVIIGSNEYSEGDHWSYDESNKIVTITWTHSSPIAVSMIWKGGGSRLFNLHVKVTKDGFQTHATVTVNGESRSMFGAVKFQLPYGTYWVSVECDLETQEKQIDLFSNTKIGFNFGGPKRHGKIPWSSAAHE